MYIEVLLTFMLLGGVVIYYRDDIQVALNILKVQILFDAGRMNHHAITENKKRNNPIDMPARLVDATLGLKSRKYGYLLIAVSFAFSVAAFCVLREHIKPVLMMAVCSFAFVLPTLILLCKLQIIRVHASREGELLITELLDNYKINYYNMQQAIEVTALTIKEAPKSKRLLFDLTKGLNTVSGQEEIRKLLEDFEFALGTSWAVVLADNMYYALVSGIRVTAALEDLVNTVLQARKVAEFSKRENNESGMILKYLVPCCYLLTILGATKFFGLTAGEYLKYQFMTTVGMGWFVTSVLMYLAGIFLNFFLSEKKLDL